MNVRTSASAAALAALVVAGTVTACGSNDSSGTTSAPAGARAAAAGATDAAAGAAKAVNGCALVTAADLSKAVGVTYSKIDSVNGGSLCNVTAAAETNSFAFHVDREDGSLTTWTGEVATIKADDGSSTPVSGIGDQAAQGAIKEFAAESRGYIVVVINGDVNNQATAKDFTHSKSIARLLVSKL